MEHVTKNTVPYAASSLFPPAWRRLAGRVLRYAVFALLAAVPVSALLISYRAPWVWYGSRDAYQWHRMLTFTMRHDQVVYEEQPERASELLSRPADERTAYVGGPRTPPFL